MTEVAIPDSVRAARVARLATVRPDGRPHLVPIVFAVTEAETLVFAVDAKPKRSAELQRLRNIAAHPSVSVLVDGYSDDWSMLWWVRLDGVAEVVDDPMQRARLLPPLVAKYPQYRSEPPPGPVVIVHVGSVATWSA